MAADSTKFTFTRGLPLDPEPKCHIKLETGNTSYVKEEPYCFSDDEEKKIDYKQCPAKLETEDRFCTKITLIDLEAKSAFPKQEVSDEKIPPSRLYAGEGPTCCLFSIQQLPLGGASEELESKCNHCGERAHDSLTCPMAIRRDLAPRNRRRARCSLCAQPGHNRRTCARRL